MLKDKTIALIKATLPVMREHGETIAAKTYEILFKHYPQIHPLFSKAPANQPKILARSVILYSEHLDDLNTVNEVLDKIAQKHISADVHPGHYPMFGHSFILAMREVLGKSVDEEVIMAWKEAYFYFAELLIQREQALSNSKQTQQTAEIR